MKEGLVRARLLPEIARMVSWCVDGIASFRVAFEKDATRFVAFMAQLDSETFELAKRRIFFVVA